MLPCTGDRTAERFLGFAGRGCLTWAVYCVTDQDDSGIYRIPKPTWLITADDVQMTAIVLI